MNISERNTETRLRDLAAERGAIVTHRGNGHFQIRGALLVNYYPFSKTRTVYIAATTCGMHGVTPERAVAMAFEPPPIAEGHRKAERGNQSRYQRFKVKMWKRGVRVCHWCECSLTRDHNKILADNYQTLDHRVPLFRGGLDNQNNWVIACRKCNDTRGHDMTELAKPLELPLAEPEMQHLKEILGV